MILVYDTETTGFFNESQPPGSPMQPHICQLGAELCDDDGRVVASMNLLVKPERWGVPPKAEEVHGISTAMCEKYGLGVKTVMMLFAQLVKRAKLGVCHRHKFDHGMVWTEFVRIQAATELATYLELPGFCTMEESTGICCLPPTPKMVAAGRHHFKTPNLQDAHTFFCGAPFDDAHDAFADVQATRRVFFEMKKRGHVPPIAVPVAASAHPDPAPTEAESVEV